MLVLAGFSTFQEMFKLMTKTDIAQVSYRGTAPAMTDIAAGVVEVMFTGPPSAMSLSAGGKVKMLAVASPRRSSLMPNVPTVQEAGVPGYELAGWFGLLAPAKTPQSVVDRLTSEVKKAVADARLKDRLTEQGLEVFGSSSDEMLAIMRSDTKKWGEVIAATGAKIPQ
jgi:tripartite-type tricarboxylate transporter receptor subunit TctC